MESGGGFTRKASGGVDEDRPAVGKNPGTAGDMDPSEEGPTPHPEAEVSLSVSSSSCGRSNRTRSRSALEGLEVREPATRKGLILDTLSPSVRGRLLSPLSRSMSTESVVDCLAPDQGRKETSPLNIGNGVAMKGGIGDRKLKKTEMGLDS